MKAHPKSEPPMTATEAYKVIVAHMEFIVRQYENLTLKQKVDLGARIRSLKRTCDYLDDFIRDEIKERLKHKDGVLNGSIWKAILAYHEEQRLDIALIKLSEPQFYDSHLTTSEVGVVRFDPK